MWLVLKHFNNWHSTYSHNEQATENQNTESEDYLKGQHSCYKYPCEQYMDILGKIFIWAVITDNLGNLFYFIWAVITET